MKINFKTKILLVIIIFILLIIIQNISYAASVTINCDSTMTKGKASTIKVTGTAVQWNLTLSVDGVTIATSRELDNYEGNIGISFSGPYTPSSTGTKNIKLEGSITDADGTTITSFTPKSITVTEPAPVTTPDPTPTTPTEPEKPAEPVVSSNANLSNLGIKPKEYDFKGFRASKTSYEVTVPNDVESIEIYANKQDSKASISGTGNKKLQEGTNVFKIVVTAENGSTKTYQLNVIRQVASTEVTPNTPEDVADTTGDVNTIGLSKLEVKGMTLSPEFAVDTYRYSIELEDEEITTLEQIKELIVAEVNFEGGTFEITGDEKLEKEENEVIISVKDTDGREIAIYTLVFKIKKVEDTADTIGILNNTIENKEDEIKNDKFGKEQAIIVISIIIISFIAIKSSITSYKQRKILQSNGLIKEKEYYEDETQEEIIENENNSEIIEEQETNISDSNEENKDYIEDIFKTSQMSFEPDEKDFVKKKRGKGKHS